MRTLDDIKKTLQRHKPELKKRFKVKRIGIFGSYMQGEGVETSDVDILVEFYEPIGWEFVDLKEFLENILGTDVDLVTVKALKPQLSEAILKEVVYA